MDAFSKSTSVPNINLSGERILEMKLRKERGKDGKPRICKLSVFELNQVRSVFERLTSALLNKGDTKPIILDTGCSRSSTGFRNEFSDGTQVRLCHTHLIYAIGTGLEAIH